VNKDDIIIGGHLNFTLKRCEVWGEISKEDILDDNLLQKLDKVNLSDMEPLKITPTWRNDKLGDKNISK